MKFIIKIIAIILAIPIWILQFLVSTVIQIWKNVEYLILEFRGFLDTNIFAPKKVKKEQEELTDKEAKDIVEEEIQKAIERSKAFRN